MRVPETWLVRDAVRRPRRVAAPAILSVVLVALAGSTPLATTAEPAQRVLLVGDVAPRVVTSGELTTEAAPDDTPGLDLRALQLEPDGGGHLPLLPESPSPSPSPAPSPSPSPSSSPSASPKPSASPVSEDEGGGGIPLWLWLVVGGILLLVLLGILGWLDTRNKDCTEERTAFEQAKAELQGTRRSYAARKSELRALLVNVNALGYTTTLDMTPWSNELPKDANMPPELAGLVVEAASEMRAAEERFRDGRRGRDRRAPGARAVRGQAGHAPRPGDGVDPRVPPRG